MWLWGLMTASRRRPGELESRHASIDLAELAHATSLECAPDQLRGRCVLVLTRDPLTAGLALIELDGLARRIVLWPPDLGREHLPAVMDMAGVDAWVTDGGGGDAAGEHEEGGTGAAFAGGSAAAESGTVEAVERPSLIPLRGDRRVSHETEWVLLTSGTTGEPKLVLHTLATLTSAVRRQPVPAGPGALQTGPVVWGTFYDIRRYGGLQIFLRAMLSGSLVLPKPSEAAPDYLTRAAAAGVTHISGTPSHWRRALMSGAAAAIAPRYVRLSGEIADQAILDGLRAVYPAAAVAHAFATTEAGVAFEVGDGLAGFPSALIGSRREGDVELRVEEETLRVRSPGNALRYPGDGVPPIRGEDGFVDTGDRVKLEEGRYHFVGRRGGVVNVGGLKVHPEEVEAVINDHPWVRMSLVRPRRNPITGAVVAADVVLAEVAPPGRSEAAPVGRAEVMSAGLAIDTAAAARCGERPPDDVLRREIIEHCRRRLAPHKVPAMIRFVPALEVSGSGKLLRREG